MEKIRFSRVVRTVVLTEFVIMCVVFLTSCALQDERSGNFADDQGRKFDTVNADGFTDLAGPGSMLSQNSDIELPGPSVPYDTVTGSQVPSTTSDAESASSSSSQAQAEESDPTAAEHGTTPESKPEPTPEPTPEPESALQPEPEPKPETWKENYSSMDHGYMFFYPNTWKLTVESQDVAKLATEKIVHESTTPSPDKALITFTYLPLPFGNWFEDWWKSFPHGDEHHVFNGIDYDLVATDTEGPFTRSYFYALVDHGVLKVELLYLPGYMIPLETDSADWKEYLQAREQYKSQVIQEFLEILDSVDGKV